MEERNEELEAEIKNLKEKLQNPEDTDPLYRGDEMKDLHHKTSYVHTRLEISLGDLLVRNQLEPIEPLVPLETYQQAFRSGTTIATEVPFYKKIEMAVANKQISGKLGNKIVGVNNTRKFFAHPVAYEDKLNEFKHDREKYKDALIGLEEAFNGITAVFVKLPDLKTKEPEEDSSEV